ncbi:MAG: ATP-NAD kinase [Candidatus Nephthysia bennettiae]|uniref:NAD(+)/NADH kinase n=1 Tax=Candidatus Nephthysia bennettiae TaxID=3127016 RepID=A0A934KDW8_9BACT|nr:NAD(+)/NADH kinase [Candidatus Dormibacteraeota bacterium]MBJ7614967.1 NAD(+)/NADH kinase [Candidatus Dormibacteraeota bacterium]PZR99925.1 MAG: ATP-NAD kinase [Candidatus Dormibacteraeota bacterium]
MTSTAGLIVNPAAGRDIRRLVGLASMMPHHEKAAIVRRVLRGLEWAGVERVLFLADGAGIMGAALDGAQAGIRVEPLPIQLEHRAADSSEAARRLAEAGVGVIVTLGGDGTNRAVAAGCGDVPLVAVSTGTNNVFPSMVEGTVAGLAAGLVATGQVAAAAVSRRSKRVEVSVDGAEDFALVDAAACRDAFRGAAAIWDPARVSALVLARAEPWAVGLSSIGGALEAISAGEPAGLYVELGDGRTQRQVRAILAPGLPAWVGVARWRRLALGEEVELETGTGTVALDGERELPARGTARARVTRNGPLVVDVRAALAAAPASTVAARAAKGTG